MTFREDIEEIVEDEMVKEKLKKDDKDECKTIMD